MYINTELLLEKDLTPTELILLQIIHQNRTEEVDRVIAMTITDEALKKFEDRNLIEYIKGKKSQSEFEKIRLTSKGSKLLDDLQTPEISDGDSQMFDYLCKMYLDHEDEERVIGNKKKTKMYVAIFRKELQLTLHQMYWLCWLYLSEEKFTKRLQYIFFNNNVNRYGKFKDNIEDSSLYQFLSSREEEVKLIWNKKGCL